VVAILLHAFNILLGVFAPTVHALRLHYVEFFSKFVEPGGKDFVRGIALPSSRVAVLAQAMTRTTPTAPSKR